MLFLEISFLESELLFCIKFYTWREIYWFKVVRLIGSSSILKSKTALLEKVVRKSEDDCVAFTSSDVNALLPKKNYFIYSTINQHLYY